MKIVDIYVYIENSERKRPILGELIRDVDHPLEEHELSSKPFTSFSTF